jgi:anti-sigma regulatory factor (Ser/Thr protein kinase)
VSTGPGPGHAGFHHETAFYGTGDEFIDIVVPFLRDGIDAGEPVVVACGDSNVELLRHATDCGEVRFLPRADQYSHPAGAIRAYRKLFEELTGSGANRIRVVGDVPHPGVGADWHAWSRYEAAVNHAFGPYPVWGLCPYDTRLAPPDVLHDVVCTHPHVVRPDGRHVNAEFVDPRTFLARRPTPPPPLLSHRPVIEMVDPSPRTCRAALVDAAVEEVLGPERTQDLLLAASEAVTNAHRHGVGPVAVRAWVGVDRVVLEVADVGPGPRDALAGWVPPAPDQPGGRGLWIANQLCSDMTFAVGDGCSLRLSVIATPLAA